MRSAVSLLGLVLAGAMAVAQQGTSAPKAPSSDPMAQLTQDQRNTFQAATKAFTAERYSGALDDFKALIAQLPAGTPAQVLCSKYAAEAALNTGDRAYALGLLLPIEKSDPYDWQARSLLARAYAEGGDKAGRDRELAAVVTMHKEMPATQIGKLTQILLEHDVLASGGSVRIWYSLEPWGRFKTYVYSRMYDKAGQQTLRVTLESSDFDQPLFAKEHPDQAAKGERRFSLDGYGQDVQSAGGGLTQTHATYGFFDGQPAYDLVRTRILAIAEGKASPISKMTPGAAAPAKPE